MLSEHGVLSHYLTNFTVYTLGTVALIYGVFWYSRQQAAKNAPPPPAPVAESPPEPGGSVAPGGLAIEAVLPMENTQTLYVVKAGRERFLIATSEKDTKLLSRLDHASAPAAYAPAAWYEPSKSALVEAAAEPPMPANFSERFAKSLKWLVESRGGK